MRDDDLLKTAEVAEVLRVHPKHVYRLLRAGLPGRRVGGEWRFVRGEVLAWSAARGESIPAPSPAATRAPAPPLVGVNGDVVVDVLLAQIVAQARPLVGLVQTDRTTALELLGARAILLAGFHGQKPPAHLRAERLARIHLVRREVGLAYASATKIRRIEDLHRKTIAIRPPTAGVRAHFDRALAAAGVTLAGLRAKSVVHGSHRDAVCAVVRGEADVALATAAWAARVGLRFSLLADEPYDLLLFADSLGEEHAVGICEVAQSKPFRAALREIAGYDGRGAGEIRYEPVER